LGGVLFWCLTGRPPFPPKGNVVQELAARIHQEPPSVQALRPDVPADLDRLVRRLMALHPDDRYDTPEAVMHALLPFLKAGGDDLVAPCEPVPLDGGGLPIFGSVRVHQILVVDDESSVRTFSRFVLQAEGLHCDEAENGAQALDMIGRKNYDLILLDVNMPDLS